MSSYFDEKSDAWVGGKKPRESDEKSLEQLEFERHYDLGARSYMGGLNSSYVIGEVRGDIIDIDFSSCYPSALNMIQNMTYEVSGGIEEFKIELEKYDGTYLPIAMADIEFEFPFDCLHPSLPIKNGDAGLFYVLKGRTTCTLPEIHFALKQGCVIAKWHDAVVMKCDEGFTFREFLSELIKARDDAKKEGNNMLQLILKDFVNGMYGKVAQGINRRSTYVVGKGISRPLPPSAVTNPYIASAVTGVVRAALSSIVHALSRLEGYMVISATTDGVLYKAPLSGGCTSVIDLLFDADVLEKKYTGSVVQALEGGSNDYIKSFEFVDSVLYQELLKYPSVRLLQASRAVLGFDEFIEIKHIATEVTNLKTRGQVGFYEYEGVQYPTVLAKAGNKIDGSKLEQSTELLKMFYDDEIAYNEVTTLASMRDILDPKKAVNDLVSVTTRVKVNTDYDFKRRPANVNSDSTI
ncbi:DNA polymerase [Sulfuricurvum sp.]|uniref:DNA polymerase n=1 Tax=Sulfuricurvum sp. TaxID=2025608 RepID=UPI00286E8BAE|nr:DNA polymerase [Sulfuricurvum sp.]